MIDLVALLFAANVYSQPLHNFAGFLRSIGGTCVGTIRGGQTCGQCADLIQQSLAECPGLAKPGCSPTCK